MKKISRAAFHLKKVKRGDKGGLLVSFDYELGGNSEIDSVNVKDFESTVEPHPDLMTKIRSLNPMLAETHYFSLFRSIANEVPFKATAAQKKALEMAYQTICEKIRPTGIALSGEDKNRGVIITGRIQTADGMSVGMNSQRIRLESQFYEFVPELENIIEDLEEEVYLYLYENKKSQLSLFDEDEQTETEETK